MSRILFESNKLSKYKNNALLSKFDGGAFLICFRCFIKRKAKQTSYQKSVMPVENIIRYFSKLHPLGHLIIHRLQINVN